MIETRAAVYSAGDTVSFYINSTTADFDLEIKISDPTGFELTTLLITPSDYVDMTGWYGVSYAKSSFVLPSDFEDGIWNWTAIDIAPTPDVKLATDLFTVGEVVEPQPDLPAETTGEEMLDSTGAPATSFALGATVLASAEVTNAGTQSQTMLIIAQLKDPELRVIAPMYILITLTSGQSVTPSISFPIPTTGYDAGTWTATIMVFDAWPAQNGVPIGTATTISFTVTG